MVTLSDGLIGYSKNIVKLIKSETTLYIVKRLSQAALTLLLASALCFAIVELAPGNYLDTLKENPQITPERIAELTKQFGLDQPAIVQYWRWLIRIITRFDFGESFVYFLLY